MKGLALSIVMVLAITGAAMAKDFEVTKKAGDFTVTAKIDKNPPATGDNTLSVTVKNASGAEVTDAKVAVEHSMAAMPGMPAVRVKTNAELKGGEYRAKLNFSMAGGWSIAIIVNRGDKKAQAKFNVDVR